MLYRLGAHLLIGLYLHSVGHYSMALRHFYLVVQANASPSQAVFGRICCALSEIGANTSESVSHALDAIGPGPNNTDNTPMESGERAVHHFASGMLPRLMSPCCGSSLTKSAEVQSDYFGEFIL